MIQKIISGGQTGADRAALDAAISWQIPHGGWIPKGRRAEDGRIPNKYHMKEMPTPGYPERTEKNVLDSEGTLILSHGGLEGGSEFTRKVAEKKNRPCLHIDLTMIDPFNAAVKIKSWLTDCNVKILNVAGPRASNDPKIYPATIKVLTTLFHMDMIENSMSEPYRTAPFLPRTVQEAVDMLTSELPLKSRAMIANMEREDLIILHSSLGEFILNRFRLRFGDGELAESCRRLSSKESLHVDDVVAIIIEKLWESLQKTHTLRLIK